MTTRARRHQTPLRSGDFPAWLWSYGQRDRHMIVDMAVGERTFELAGKYGVSAARVSQLRREYCEDWQHFTNTDEVKAAG